MLQGQHNLPSLYGSRLSENILTDYSLVSFNFLKKSIENPGIYRMVFMKIDTLIMILTFWQFQDVRQVQKHVMQITVISSRSIFSFRRKDGIISNIIKSNNSEMDKITKLKNKVYIKRENQVYAPINCLMIKKYSYKKLASECKENKLLEEKGQNSKANVSQFQTQHHLSSHFQPMSFGFVNSLSKKDGELISIDNLKEPNFPVLNYKTKDLIEFSLKIVKTSKFTSKCFQNDVQILQFLRTLAQNYKCVPYHNFSHAFSLMHLNYQCLTRQVELKNIFTEQEYFYILIAGLSHDLGHNGTNNQFQIKCKTENARMTNNKSILQNMHLRKLWKILEENPKLDFLKSSTNKKTAKHIITRLILNTDMTNHSTSLDNFRTLKKNDQLKLFQDGDHKWILMEQIFHACDVGNSCSQYDNYICWIELLSYEFSHQVHLQKNMKLEVTKSFIFDDVSCLYKDQVWFLGNIVQPLWKQISEIFPNLELYSKNVAINLERVKEELDKLRP